VASSIIALLTSCALLTAQVPIEETSGQSTIKVKKKKKVEEEPVEPPVHEAPPTPAPPQVRRAAVPQVAPPPPPPRPSEARAAPAQLLETRPAPRTEILPWVALAGSVVATGIGIFFAVRTGKTIDEQSELEFELNTSKSRVKIPEEFTDNQKAVFINSITATVLISAGLSGTIASSVALMD
jgi:hypothetical protein